MVLARGESMSGGITIKDVAKEAGLSVTTVSLVLNNKNARISDKTRKHVREVAKRLNYRPNRLAVGLITKRTNIIGLIVPDIANQYFAEIAAAVEYEASEHGYNVIFCNTNDRPEKDIAYVDMLLQQGVDGILFTMSVNSDSNCAEECLAILKKAEIPVILIDRVIGEDKNEVTFVAVNDEECGYYATYHLIDLGHRKIGCITGSMGDYDAIQRLEGYKHALYEAGIAFDPELVAEGNYHMASGYNSVTILTQKKVTGIFAHNDMMALGAYKRLTQLGIKVPEDISLVGIDNLSFTELLEVPFTTIERTPGRMGEIAVKKMIAILNKQDTKNEHIIYSPRLIVRKSTAKPQ
jgi:LacI family transcriptional regulator